MSFSKLTDQDKSKSEEQAASGGQLESFSKPS